MLKEPFVSCFERMLANDRWYFLLYQFGMAMKRFSGLNEANKRLQQHENVKNALEKIRNTIAGAADLQTAE